jgi:bacterioferritin (cytochrome b1)
MQYYISFVSFMSGRDAVNDFNIIPTFRFVCQGRSTMLDWRTYKGLDVPSYDPIDLDNYKREIQEKQKQQENTTENTTLEIDWSALDITGDTDIAIDSTVKEIDWADVEQEQKQSIEIDFGDDMVVEESATDNTNNHLKQIYEWSNQSIFEDTDMRNAFWNDIVEIEAFFSQRILEKSESSATSTTVEGEIFKEAPSEIRNESLDELNRFNDAVASVLQTVNNPQFRQLLMLKMSKRYVERTTRSLQQKLDLVDKLNENVSGVDARRDELHEKITKLEPEVDMLIARTRKLQEQLQTLISKLIPKERRINIFGEINTILA